MSIINLTPKFEQGPILRISDLDDGDFFQRTETNGGGFGLRVEDHVVFFYGRRPPSLFMLSEFPDEAIERRIESVEIIER